MSQRFLLCVLLVSLAFCLVGVAAAQDPISSVSLTATPQAYVGPCPVTLHFEAKVGVEAYPMIFNYTFERSDNAKGPLKIYTVHSGEHVAVVSETWQLGGTPGREFEVWMKIRVNSGNTHLVTGPARVTITCR